MDKLTEFIRENSESLNSHTLPQGHEQRFLDKLHTRHVRPKTALWRAAAAAAIVGFAITAGLGGVLHRAGILPMSAEQRAATLFPSELVEVDQSYRYMVNQKRQQVCAVLAQNTQYPKEDFAALFNEFEQGNSTVLDEVSQSGNTEMAKYIISRHYQAQLAVLDGLLTGLEQK